MGKGQKKNGKGRLDHYYRLAKEKGYRARAAFKLLQINQKYDNFLQKSKVVIDLCAAPGSWCQVASQLCPLNSLIVGVDLDPIKPIPNVITFQEDITSDRCRAQLRQYIKTWKADAVLHDGAPNVGAAWIQDAFTQAELVLQSLKLATEFLNVGGIFVTKVFRSKDYNNLLWVFNQFFSKVEATKPPSSRNVSAEIFVVCRGYKAPKKIDPRLLDPRSVFADLTDPTPNYEAKVYNPEQKKRKRQGYDENTSIGMFETCLLGEFVRAPDPIKILGSVNQLKIDINADDDAKKLKKMPETSREILDLCSDLKVLGRKDFKNLLKWRLKAREQLGLKEEKSNKDENQESVEIEPIDEEQAIDDELESFRKVQEGVKKRERRRENERKRKDIIRMQMNMLTPADIGIDAEQMDDSVFSLKQAEKSGVLQKLAKGKLSKNLPEADEEDEQILLGSQSDKRKPSQDNEDEDEDEEMSEAEREMELEEELDEMYQAYEERRQERDARYKVKKAKSARNDEWYGFKEGEQNDEEEDDEDDYDEGINNKEYSSDSESESEEEEEGFNGKLSTNLESKQGNGLSKRASLFFDQDGFKDIEDDSEDELDQSGKVQSIEVKKDKYPSTKQEPTPESDSESDSGFDIVKTDGDEQESEDDEENWSDSERYVRHADGGGNHDIGLITAEAMTLAHEIALGRQSKEQIVDETFNKYAFRDLDDLPDWFVDDERRHSKPNRPITKEAADAIKAKLRELNARPIKKVAEANARKKYKAAQRLEKLKRKSDVINEDSGRSEREKADAISSLMQKGTRKQSKTTKPRPTLVIARGKNKAISGRPRGVKGRYKMVDGVMKKEQRALKRVAKARK